jgi:hypothetical protein
MGRKIDLVIAGLFMALAIKPACASDNKSADSTFRPASEGKRVDEKQKRGVAGNPYSGYGGMGYGGMGMGYGGMGMGGMGMGMGGMGMGMGGFGGGGGSSGGQSRQKAEEILKLSQKPVEAIEKSSKEFGDNQKSSMQSFSSGLDKLQIKEDNQKLLEQLRDASTLSKETGDTTGIKEITDGIVKDYAAIQEIQNKTLETMFNAWVPNKTQSSTEKNPTVQENISSFPGGSVQNPLAQIMGTTSFNPSQQPRTLPNGSSAISTGSTPHNTSFSGNSANGATNRGVGGAYNPPLQ